MTLVFVIFLTSIGSLLLLFLEELLIALLLTGN